MHDFIQFAATHGVIINNPVDDGRLQRCPTSDHPKQRDGAYRFFGTWGWVQDWSNHEKPIIWKADGTDAVPVTVMARDVERIRREEARRRQQAAQRAVEIVRSCKTKPHAYLTNKGFPLEVGLVDSEENLIIAMRDMLDYRRINSVQSITNQGEKKFLYGGAAKGSIFIIGSGEDRWLCEGYATGLSIRAALRYMHQPSSVVVCFSASNLAHVAGAMGGRRLIVADNDQSGTGERFAASSGLPWVMPPDVGHDANDMHKAHGIPALANLLRGIM
jgi:putative DNA primase/helicase